MDIEIRNYIQDYLEHKYWEYKIIYFPKYKDYIKKEGIINRRTIIHIPIDEMRWLIGNANYSIDSIKSVQQFYYYVNYKYKLVLWH
jgi:hypothetical protein